MEKVVLKAGQHGWLNTVKSIGIVLVHIETMQTHNLVYSWKYNVITIVFVMVLIGVYYPLSRLVKEYLPILNGEFPHIS